VVLYAMVEVMLRPTIALALLAGASIYGVACAGSPPFESDYVHPKSDGDAGSSNGSSTGPNGNPTPASSGDDGGTSTNAGDDGGGGTTSTGDDGGGASGDDGGGATGNVNGCTAADFAANDMSAPSATRAITFGPSGQIVIVGRVPEVLPITPSQYTPNCMTISSTESVTWTGAFASLPLAPSGGTNPTPITSVTTGTTTSFAFPTTGTFGFENPNAPTVMFGAILVIP
jgi:hypothetical protein